MVKHEVIKGDLQISKVYLLANNLDIAEKKRKFAWTHVVIFVDADCQVAGMVRTKGNPSGFDAKNFVRQFPETVYFISRIGYYASESEIAEAVSECELAHRIREGISKGKKSKRRIEGLCVVVPGEKQ